jgi:hypothetical protein
VTARDKTIDALGVGQLVFEGKAQRLADCYNACLPLGNNPAAAIRTAREALETIHKRLDNTAGGGTTLKSRESIRKVARAALEGLGGEA